MGTTIPVTPDLEAVRRQVLTTIRTHWKLFLFQGILMLVLGMLAVALPNISTLEIELLVGSLLIIGGILRVIMIFRKPHMPGFWWSVANGVLAVAVGGILLARPIQGVLTLTILLAAFFVIEGVAALFIALEFRRYLRSWGWTLLSGVVNLVLACLVWRGWPNSATWVIGFYVGINMIFLGVPLIMNAIAARSMEPSL